MKTMTQCCLFFLITIDIATRSMRLDAQELLQKLAIKAEPGDSTTFVYTNKDAGYYYGETGRLTSTAFEGWNVFTQEYLEDYVLLVDGQPLSRRLAEVEILPDKLVRRYSAARLTEEVILLDSLDVLAIKLRPETPTQVTFIPAFSGARNDQAFVIAAAAESPVFAVALKSRMQPVGAGGVVYPAWIGVATSDLAQRRSVSPAAQDSLARLFAAPAYTPAAFEMMVAGSVVIFMMVDSDVAALEAVLQTVQPQIEALAAQRAARLQLVLARSAFRSNLKEFDRALGWAKIAVDNLIMNQQGRGIFAGLPWFNNYWGRDTFIALPGATLVTGNYREAREILRSFSRFQLRDPNDPRDGRIPNRAMPGEIIYNTADGTPWFIRATCEYIDYSGDQDFAAEILPVLSYAIHGALAHQTDNLGLFVHADADTWMDAVGPQGPWSPRGNRAVEIQALWYDALQRTATLASAHNDAALAGVCRAAAERLRRVFLRLYWNAAEHRLFDHLDTDGSRDRQIRPNQIFAVSAPSPRLITVDQGAAVTADVVARLTYRYGVASLDQQDDNFHPYHHYAPYYVQDAAYHNGIVWTWLSGPVNSALCQYGRQDLAFAQLQSAAEQILSRGSFGTQSELLDALPRPGESFPRFSGTVSQAWNLAEFVRNVYQDILGVHIDATNRKLTLTPHLPDSLQLVRFTVWVGETPVTLTYGHNGSLLMVDGLQEESDQPIALEIFDAASDRVARGVLEQNQKIAVTFDRRAKTANGDGMKSKEWEDAAFGHVTLAEAKFATPALRPDLPAMAGPQWPLLRSAQVVRPFPSMTLIAATDPAGDDRGSNGTYRYPQNPAFEPGIFDLRSFEIAEQDTGFFFRFRLSQLVQPGWHPEYGYQLTYLALAIDSDQDSTTGAHGLGMNGQQALPKNFGADRFIYIGGGAKVTDASGKTLVEFVPDDPNKTPGNVASASITLALPKRYFSGNPQKWRMAMYTGAQDDHGGAGIGEFRAVRDTVGEWHGGGNKTDGSNIYDSLLIEPSMAR